jgi:hypothetical protein
MIVMRQASIPQPSPGAPQRGLCLYRGLAGEDPTGGSGGQTRPRMGNANRSPPRARANPGRRNGTAHGKPRGRATVSSTSQYAWSSYALLTRVLVSAIWIFFSPLPGSAQNDILRLPPVTVTAPARLPEVPLPPSSIPASVQVITGEEIRNSGALTLQDFLMRLGGSH